MGLANADDSTRFLRYLLVQPVGLGVADRRMRLERERACDDHVLTNGCRATDYASHLLEIARTSRQSVFAARAAVAMAQPSWIEKRLRVILATDRNRRPVTKIAGTVSVLTVACLVLLIGVMSLAEAVEEEELLQQIRESRAMEGGAF